jgi:hypothetical protein
MINRHQPVLLQQQIKRLLRTAIDVPISVISTHSIIMARWAWPIDACMCRPHRLFIRFVRPRARFFPCKQMKWYAWTIYSQCKDKGKSTDVNVLAAPRIAWWIGENDHIIESTGKRWCIPLAFHKPKKALQCHHVVAKRIRIPFVLQFLTLK